MIDYQLTGDTPAEHRLSFTVNDNDRAELETELFGKRVLITDRDDWPVTEVIAGYRSRSWRHPRPGQRGLAQRRDVDLGIDRRRDQRAVPEQVRDLLQRGPVCEQPVASEWRSRLAPRIGASISALRNARATASPTIWRLISAPVR